MWDRENISPPVLIDDATVARLLAPAEVRDVIAGAFTDPSVAPARLVAEVQEGERRSRTLLAMPALRRNGLAIVKVVCVIRDETTRLASHLLALSERGELLAVIASETLTARRTAAASVLAAQTLGCGGARRLAVIGAGRQAKAQFQAFAAALPLKHVALWARRTDAAKDLAVFAREHVRSVRIAASPGDAIRDVDLVTCATGATAPLICGADTAPGTHVDLVGGFRPDMREADDALISRASITIDCAAALREAGDLVQPIANGVLDPARVHLLADLLRGRPSRPDAEVSVFKSVGHAAEDLVVAERLVMKLGLGGSRR